MVASGTDAAERASIAEALREYCKLDTYAMFARRLSAVRKAAPVGSR